MNKNKSNDRARGRGTTKGRKGRENKEERRGNQKEEEEEEKRKKEKKCSSKCCSMYQQWLKAFEY